MAKAVSQNVDVLDRAAVVDHGVSDVNREPDILWESIQNSAHEVRGLIRILDAQLLVGSCKDLLCQFELGDHLRKSISLHSRLDLPISE